MKTLLSIIVKKELEENETCLREWQSLKAFSPILRTNFGMDICCNEEHWQNALLHISFTDSEIVICFKDLQPWKSCAPYRVIEEGIIIDFNDEQSINAPLPISFTEDGMSIFLNEIGTLLDNEIFAWLVYVTNSTIKSLRIK